MSKISFEDFWQRLNPQEKKEFAAKCDREVSYLRHVAKGRKPASPALATAIELASKRKVLRETLRPDVFGSGFSAA